MLTQRLRVAGPPARPEPRTIPLRAMGKPTAIGVRPAVAGDVARAIKTLPGRRLAGRGAMSFDCQGSRLVFVFDAASLEQGVDMLKRRGDVGILAEPPGMEGMERSTRYRVSVEPEAHSTFRVLVKTRAGRTVLAGGESGSGAAR